MKCTYIYKKWLALSRGERNINKPPQRLQYMYTNTYIRKETEWRANHVFFIAARERDQSVAPCFYFGRSLMDAVYIFSDAPPAGEIKVGRDPPRDRFASVCIMYVCVFCTGLSLWRAEGSWWGWQHTAELAIALGWRQNCPLGGTTWRIRCKIKICSCQAAADFSHRANLSRERANGNLWRCPFLHVREWIYIFIFSAVTARQQSCFFLCLLPESCLPVPISLGRRKVYTSLKNGTFCIIEQRRKFKRAPLRSLFKFYALRRGF